MINWKRTQRMLTVVVAFLIVATAGIALYVQVAPVDTVDVRANESGWLWDNIPEGKYFGSDQTLEVVGDDLDAGVKGYLADIYLMMPVPLFLSVLAWVAVDWKRKSQNWHGLHRPED